MDNNFTVYCHISPSSKKYVGISTNPVKRWNCGRGYKNNYRSKRAIDKYGWDNFQHIIIAEGLSESDAKSMEKRLVDEWHLTDFNFGYNLREGGDGNHSAASRALMSASQMGNTNGVGRVLSEDTKHKIADSLSQYYSSRPGTFKGKKHTPETIAKLKARVVSPETKQKMRDNHYDASGVNNPSAKPVRQLTINGEIVQDYPYAKLAAKTLRIDLSSIIKCCRGKCKTSGGFRWEYINKS